MFLKSLKIVGPVLMLVVLASSLLACQPSSQESPAAFKSIESIEKPVHTKPAATRQLPSDTETMTEPTPVYATSTNYSLELTPVEKMGITGIAQDIDIESYHLIIDGLVDAPLSLSYGDVLEYTSVIDVGVINCPGFFVDIGEWTGVPVRTLLDEAGLSPDAARLTFYGLDGYRYTLSLEHVDEYGVFLAYFVNGKILPPEHGYPLRVVDNGSTGAAWVKWLARIEVE